MFRAKILKKNYIKVNKKHTQNNYLTIRQLQKIKINS